MTQNFTAMIHSGLNDPAFCSNLLDQLKKELKGRRFRFMEVCGTHTAAIFQTGLHSLLPENLMHISGPGCPVCVTHDSEISLILELAARPDAILASFGDLLRVPGPNRQSLKHAKARGAKIEIVYSPLQAVEIAQKNPDMEVVFLGAGFETTAPCAAAAILSARKLNLRNFSVLSLHKLTPPALRALLADNSAEINGFLLPGHVAAVTGLEPFSFISEEFGLPAVVAGFEPADILIALIQAVKAANKAPKVINAYPRAVNDAGNPKALQLLDSVFRKQSALWRGLGEIPESGLACAFAEFDAMKKLNLKLPQAEALPGCQCGEILKGRRLPSDCPLFAKKCSPANPVGPCMVSSEGSCAAYYKYGNY